MSVSCTYRSELSPVRKPNGVGVGGDEHKGRRENIVRTFKPFHRAFFKSEKKMKKKKQKKGKSW